ncbi:MAG: hypothetical protein ABFD79_09015 [Phycisphaerales bacterium]
MKSKWFFVSVLLLIANVNYAGQVVSDVIKEFRTLHTTTDLTFGGSIVIPESNKYEQLAKKIQVKLKQVAGADYQITSSLPSKISNNQVVIAIGNMMNNYVIERLYWNFYTMVNPTYPGANGYVIETVHQPLPIFPSNNVVVLGGSNLETCEQAVNGFIGKINSKDECKFNPILEVTGDVEQKRESSKNLEKVKGLRGFRSMADLYHKTGKKKYLKASITALSKYCKMTKENPNWILFWGDEIDSFREVLAWDFVQEHAGLSDAENLVYEQFFLNYINKLVDRAEIYGRIKPEPVLAWNHTTIPLLGMYASARYYKTHYGFKDVEPVLEQVSTYLNGQKENYRVSEDSVNYLTFILNFCLAYYDMTNEMEYFNNGNARKIADLIFAQIDNTGYAAGTGDITPGFDLSREKPWDYMEWKLPLPELYWFRQQSEAKAETLKSAYYPEMRPKRPDYLEGCVVIPLDKGLYNHLADEKTFNMLAAQKVPKIKPNCAYEKAFDKLQFRTFEPDGGEYLLVDGMGSGNHGHRDTASIVCGTFEGCRFLDDADKLLGKCNQHSMISIVKDGENVLPVPPFAALDRKYDFSEGAYAGINVANYNDTSWKRHIYWCKNKYFVVIDTLKAEKAGKYKYECSWTLADRGNEKYDGRNLMCSGPKEGIDKTTDIPQKTFNLKSVDEGWISRSKDATTRYPSMRIHQDKKYDMKVGQVAAYQNIFYLQRGDNSYEPIKISETAMILKQDNSKSLIVAGNGLKGFESDSDFIVLGSDSLVGINVSKVEIDKKLFLSSTNKIDLYINQGKLEIASSVTGSLKLMFSGGKFGTKYNKGVTKVNLPENQFAENVSSFIAQIEPAKIKKDADLTSNQVWKPVWNTGNLLSDLEEKDVCVGDINNDKKNEIIFASGKDVLCLTEKGSTLWKYTSTLNVISCTITPDAAEGIKVVVGTDNATLLGLSESGTLIKTVKVEIEGSDKHGAEGDPWVTHLKYGDVNKDGEKEIIAGMRSWSIHVFNKELNQIWFNSMVLHGVADIALGNLKTDSHLLYVGDKYGGAHIFDVTKDNDKDVSSRKTKTIIGDIHLGIVDLNGDGIEDIISASNGGGLEAYDASIYFNGQAKQQINPDEAIQKKIWKYNNFGFGFVNVKYLNMKKPVLAAATESGYLLFLNPSDGKLLYSSDMGSAISTMEIADKCLVVGTARGDILKVDFSGKVIKKGKVSSGVIKIQPVSNNLVILDCKGQISFFNL